MILGLNLKIENFDLVFKRMNATWGKTWRRIDRLDKRCERLWEANRSEDVVRKRQTQMLERAWNLISQMRVMIASPTECETAWRCNECEPTSWRLLKYECWLSIIIAMKMIADAGFLAENVCLSRIFDELIQELAGFWYSVENLHRSALRGFTFWQC